MYTCLVLPSCHHLFHLSFFFFNDTATTEIYTLSLHDALPISPAPDDSARNPGRRSEPAAAQGANDVRGADAVHVGAADRSEEHTSELQSHSDLVCRLLLEKKKKNKTKNRREET